MVTRGDPLRVTGGDAGEYPHPRADVADVATVRRIRVLLGAGLTTATIAEVLG